MITLDSRDLDRRVRIERPVDDDSFDSAGSRSWNEVAIVWASILDLLPSRGEAKEGGITVATRRARIRMRFRSDIDASMRLVAGDRVMQIVSGPAELGRRAGLEIIVEDYTSAGNAA